MKLGMGTYIFPCATAAAPMTALDLLDRAWPGGAAEAGVVSLELTAPAAAPMTALDLLDRAWPGDLAEAGVVSLELT